LAAVAAMLAMRLPLPAQDPASAQGVPLLDELDIELKVFSGYRAKDRDDKPKNVFAELESNGGGWRLVSYKFRL
jgi:hypothetical protein